jgi:hypothetical protein
MKAHHLRSGYLLICLLGIAFFSQSVRAQTNTTAKPKSVVGSDPIVFGLPFTNVDVSGAGTGALQGTYIKGIDAAGDVAGSYIDSNGAYHGFVFLANGTITKFDVANAGSGAGEGTFVTDISPAGNISGYYIPSGVYLNPQAFVRATDGTIAPFEVDSDRTQALGINSAGTATGVTFMPDGFVRLSDAAITTFDVPIPGQTGPYAVFGTAGIAINTAGVIAGRYMDNNYISRGYVRSADGTTITPFDPPSLPTTQTTNGNSGTIPTSINTAGEIAGTFTDAAGARHSFVRTTGGTITPFDPAGTDTSTCATSGMGKLICGSGALGINDAGDIVGAYFDADKVAHGYLRSGTTSQITSFDVPGAGNGAFQGTAGFAVNTSGTVAGTYVDTNNVLHGFIHNLGLDTTTTLTPSQSATIFGQPATFTASVSSAGGAPPNGESVLFMNGTTQLGSETLAGGTASFTTTMLPVGSDSITAVYNGDSTLAGSSSTAVSQAVSKASTTTTLTSSPNPSGVGQTVNLTATVAGQFGGTATGSMAFSNGSTNLGSVSFSNGTASLSTTSLPLGTASITAVYSGDSNFTGSTSATVGQVVVAPDFTISVSPASLTIQSGLSGTETMTITRLNGFSPDLTITCSSGSPAAALCNFSLATQTSPGVYVSTITVTSNATNAALHRNPSPLLPGSALAVVLCCFGLRKRRRLQLLLLLSLSLTGLSLFTGCGGGSSVGGSKSVTSTVTVTAASGTLSHATTFSLTVN